MKTTEVFTFFIYCHINKKIIKISIYVSYVRHTCQQQITQSNRELYDQNNRNIHIFFILCHMIKKIFHQICNLCELRRHTCQHQITQSNRELYEKACRVMAIFCCLINKYFFANINSNTLSCQSSK